MEHKNGANTGPTNHITGALTTFNSNKPRVNEKGSRFITLNDDVIYLEIVNSQE